MVTVFVHVRMYTGDIIKSLDCGVLFEWALYRAVLGLLVAGYLEIKLKKEQVASNQYIYWGNIRIVSTDKAEEGSKRATEAILEHQIWKIFLGGMSPKGLPSCCVLTHAVAYSARPIQFCFRRACIMNNNQCLASNLSLNTIIGVSQSEPHTSVTALHTRGCTYACLDWPLTLNLNERIQIFHDDRHRVNWGTWRPVESYCQSAALSTRRKTTEVKALVALVCASTDDGRPLIGGTNLISWSTVDRFR